MIAWVSRFVLNSMPNFKILTTIISVTNNMPDHLGFRIVITIEKNVIGCFEIGDNKNELTKKNEV